MPTGSGAEAEAVPTGSRAKAEAVTTLMVTQQTESVSGAKAETMPMVEVWSWSSVSAARTVAHEVSSGTRPSSSSWDAR